MHYCLYWAPFPSPRTTRRNYGGSILTRLHTGLTLAMNVWPIPMLSGTTVTNGIYFSRKLRAAYFSDNDSPEHLSATLILLAVCL
jgi:hypothetical protein